MKKLMHQFNHTVGWGSVLLAGAALASLTITGVPWESLFSGFSENQLWFGVAAGSAVGLAALGSHDKEHGGLLDSPLGKIVLFVGLGILAGGVIDYALFHDHPLGQAIYGGLKDIIMPILDVVANVTGNGDLTLAAIEANAPVIPAADTAVQTAAAAQGATPAVTQTVTSAAENCIEGQDPITGMMGLICN